MFLRRFVNYFLGDASLIWSFFPRPLRRFYRCKASLERITLLQFFPPLRQIRNHLAKKHTPLLIAFKRLLDGPAHKLHAVVQGKVLLSGPLRPSSALPHRNLFSLPCAQRFTV